MISLSNMTMHYGYKTLFEDVTLCFDPGKRYGIVGANGSGKSTLLQLLSGREHATEGSISMSRHTRLGVLNQDHFQYEKQHVINVVLQGKPALWKALQEKEQLLLHDSIDETTGHRLGELEETIAHQNGYNAESFAGELLSGLGIENAYHSGPMSSLSGGFKLRVLLAQVLFKEPELLLLDEPTNHLDIISIAWLEHFLKNVFAGTLLVVSHDRNFLNAICTDIADIDYETVRLYPGNYDFFLEAKALAMEQKLKEIASQEKKIAEMQSFVDRFRSKATKARQAQSRVKQIERVELPEIKRSSRVSPIFNFQQKRPSGKEVVTIQNISKAFGNKQVLQGVDITVMRNDKIAVIGPNGIGKSTLLKIIMGELQSDQGSYTWGYEAHISYFAQDLSELFKEDKTVYDWLYQYGAHETIGTIRGLLGRVLFSGDDVEKSVTSLSGGERARLLFAKLILEKGNVLILDEPTNHLDLEGIEALGTALKSFPGTLLLVSHDRYFVSNIATRILALTPTEVRDFSGSYEEYVSYHGDDYLTSTSSLMQTRTSRDEKNAVPDDSVSYEKRKELKRLISQLSKKNIRFEKLIESQEGQLAEIDAQFSADSFYDNATPESIQTLQTTKQQLTRKLSENMEMWEQSLIELENAQTLLNGP
ncbi:MAG: ATP-binding cassette domain-containing protein [SAR324 cluster bacterium]|nr:ATP-binding cassette domain-containing protein [SAR324 cluster bacterium]